MAREGILIEHRLHDPAQAREATPQIGHVGGDPDLRAGRQSNHLSKHSSTMRNVTGSTLPSSLSCPRSSLR